MYLNQQCYGSDIDVTRCSRRAVDRFGGSVAGAGPVEVGHDVDGSFVHFSWRERLTTALSLLGLLTFSWVDYRPGSGGHNPPRVSIAMAINASGL